MKLTICAGTNKAGLKEGFDQLDLITGNLYALCGNTGAGKSQLIKDIEMLVNKDSISHRKIMIDDKIPDRLNTSLIAHLGQNMRFVLDISVNEFINMHLSCRKNTLTKSTEVIALANTITTEIINGNNNLLSLSGGQSRALMIADIALVCNSHIVLIDEIENAGVDKTLALNALLDKNKLVLIVTHDPHTMLLASSRIILESGGIKAVVPRTTKELTELDKLSEMLNITNTIRTKLKRGESL
jgi:ABC-type lipoprotein export system ATPase subunit